jgi:hypothetical protein
VSDPKYARDRSLLVALVIGAACVFWGLHQRQATVEDKLVQTCLRVRELEYAQHPEWRLYDAEHPNR